MRFHFCCWDRDCRREGAPPRIYLHTKRRMFWVDVPGWWKGITWNRRGELPELRWGRFWNPPGLGAHVKTRS